MAPLPKYEDHMEREHLAAVPCIENLSIRDLHSATDMCAESSSGEVQFTPTCHASERRVPMFCLNVLVVLSTYVLMSVGDVRVIVGMMILQFRRLNQSVTRPCCVIAASFDSAAEQPYCTQCALLDMQYRKH